MASIHLAKPIVFFDIEATGLNVAKDQIIEISFLKLMPSGEEISKTWRIRPEVPISEDAYKVHGISMEELKDEPTFKEVAKDIIQFIGNADFSGYNLINYDLPLLVEEFLRASCEFDLDNRRIIDVQRIFHKMERRTLAAAYKFYCQKELSNAHSAEADTRATMEVLKAQIDHYPELTNKIDELHEFTGSPANKMVDLAGRLTKNNKGEVVFNFGKYKGKVVEEVFTKDPGYYGWMMNADFPLHTKNKLTEIRLKMKISQ